MIHLQKGIGGSAVRGIQRGVWGTLQQFTYNALKIVEALHELQDGQDLGVVCKVEHSSL